MGGGSVHHIAFRAADDAAQAAMVQSLAAHHGIRTTEQKDRNYFRSVYFREPGGVLFEIATDDAGLCRRRARRQRSAATSSCRAVSSRAARDIEAVLRTADDLPILAAVLREDRRRKEHRPCNRPVLHPPLRSRNGSHPARRSSFCTAPAATRTTCSPLGEAASPGGAVAVAARQGAGERHAAFLPPAAEGVFDEDDVDARANELADFVAEARQAYGLARADGGRLLERRQHRGGDAAAAARGARRCGAAARHGAALRPARRRPCRQAGADAERL